MISLSLLPPPAPGHLQLFLCFPVCPCSVFPAEIQSGCPQTGEAAWQPEAAAASPRRGMTLSLLDRVTLPAKHPSSALFAVPERRLQGEIGKPLSWTTQAEETPAFPSQALSLLPSVSSPLAFLPSLLLNATSLLSFYLPSPSCC